MKLSNKCDYALRAMMALSLAQRQGCSLCAREIASREGIPLKFLEQILLTLKRAGLLTSRMGTQGGYLLAKPPEKITFGEVMRVVDGSLAPMACVEDTSAAACSESLHCGFRGVMLRLYRAMAQVVDRTTLADALGPQS